MQDHTTIGVDTAASAMTIEKDLRIPMRDGVELAADAYQAVDDRAAARRSWR